MAALGEDTNVSTRRWLDFSGVIRAVWLGFMEIPGLMFFGEIRPGLAMSYYEM